MQKLFYILLLLATWQQSLAQAPFFSYNLYRYNPAAAAVSSEWAATMDYNSYMPNMYGFGNAMNFNIEKRFTKFHSAIGLNTSTFTWGEGAVLRRDANLSYSYQWALSKKENSPILAFGAESGLSYRISGVERGGYPFIYTYSLYPNLNTGVHFYLPNQKFYVSAVMRDILPSRNGFDYLFPFGHNYRK